MGKHVLLITSTNLACNPRCLKEVRLLQSMNIEVSVVAFNLHNWTDKEEKKLHQELTGVNFYYLETTRYIFFSWAYSSFIEKISRQTAKFFPSNIFIQAIAISKRSWLLNRWARKWDGNPDLIIAHNPPAFYAAYRLAEKIKKPFAIDIEDYHPAEKNTKTTKASVTLLMKYVLAKAAYISSAAPLIKDHITKLVENNNSIVINNAFSQSEFIAPSETNKLDGKIKFVWFSQFIDYGRGLEKILPVMDKFSDEISLTLIGNLRESFFQAELKDRKYINCVASLSQRSLNNELHNYDIGLALEDKEADMNRNICLTNKIWAYFQSGLFILASNTDAQDIFLQEHSKHGINSSLSETELVKAITTIVVNKDEIRYAKQERFQSAIPYSWENESGILINKWAELSI